MTKSFLLKLDPNNTSSSYKNLLFKEFIDGVKPSDTYDAGGMMERIKQNLKTNFGWNESVSFQKLSSHKCKDMLVVASEYLIKYCKYFFLKWVDPGLFCLFSFISNTNFTEKTVGVSGIRTCWSRRRTRWPLDHHHGPSKFF